MNKVIFKSEKDWNNFVSNIQITTDCEVYFDVSTPTEYPIGLVYRIVPDKLEDGVEHILGIYMHKSEFE